MSAPILTAAAKHIRKRVSTAARAIDRQWQEAAYAAGQRPWKPGPFYANWLRLRTDKAAGCLVLTAEGVSDSCPEVEALATDLERQILAELGHPITVRVEVEGIGTVTTTGDVLTVSRGQEVAR